MAILNCAHLLPPATQGLCSDIAASPQWGPREGRGYVAIGVSSPFGASEKLRAK